MRNWSAPLLAEARSAAPRLAQALYIKRAAGTALALTDADTEGDVSDVPIGGATEASVTFSPLPHGVTFSSWGRTVGTDVDNAEATIYEGPGDPTLILADILDQRWHAAPWVAGIYCWAHPEFGFGPLSCGVVGKIKQRVGKSGVELRDIRQLLNGNPTPVTQQGCIWTLGSNSQRDGFCRLALAPYTVEDVPVTAVASQREFTASSRAAEPADRYGNGLLTWTTGLNTGRTVRITSFAAGVFTLDEDMVQGITIGDECTLVWGCRGRFLEDCVNKFGNGLNHGGFPHAPGPDKALNPKGDDA